MVDTQYTVHTHRQIQMHAAVCDKSFVNSPIKHGYLILQDMGTGALLFGGGGMGGVTKGAYL